MGTSNWQNISYCIDIIRQIHPANILDVGVGFGRWGIVSKEFLDVWNGRIVKDSWNTRVEGIEAFAENIEEYHSYFYDELWKVDAREFFRDSINNRRYDLVIFGDVLEHFYKEEGYEILNAALNNSDFVMVNIPLGQNWEQGPLYGNEFEEHKSVWHYNDFKHLSVVRERLFNDYIGRTFGTFILSKGDILINKLLRQPQIDSEIERLRQELIFTEQYLNFLKSKKENTTEELQMILEKGEEKIMGDINKSKVKITIGETKNKNSNGSEVWIYDISSDTIAAIDLKKLKRDDMWVIRPDNNAPTGNCIIASQNGAQVEFDITGDILKLKCLSHPWSGVINILINEELILSVDLYSKNQKNIDLAISLKGA